MVSEAHISAAARAPVLIRYIPKKKRSWLGWWLFLGFIVLNETRGIYVLAEFLKALNT